MRKFVCKEDFTVHHNCHVSTNIKAGATYVLVDGPLETLKLYTLTREGDKHNNKIYMRSSEVKRYFNEVESGNESIRN